MKLQSNLKVLIVEDEIFAMQYLKKILNFLGYEKILEASNAKDATTLVKEHKVDLVFMDINIDGSIDGIQCGTIINQEYFIPIVFTTAHGDTNTIEEASHTNLFGYLVKPFEVHDVEATLQIVQKMLKLNKKDDDKQKDSKVILGNDISFDRSLHILFDKNTPINLTKKELALIELFCKNPNQNLSYEALRSNIWNNSNISDSTIRDTISRLKKAVPKLRIDNTRGVGYIFRVDS